MKRKLIIAAFVLAGALATWYVVLHPIVAAACFKNDYYTGASYYQNGSYLNLEHGERMAAFLTEFGFSSKGKVVDFYYVDSRRFDNPVYGKVYDLCVVELVYPADEYATIKAEVTKRSVADIEEVEDFVFYPLPHEDMSLRYLCRKEVAFCDKAHTVRFIIIPDVLKFDEPDETSIYREVVFDPYFSWKASEGQGDGLKPLKKWVF